MASENNLQVTLDFRPARESPSLPADYWEMAGKCQLSGQPIS